MEPPFLRGTAVGDDLAANPPKGAETIRSPGDDSDIVWRCPELGVSQKGWFIDVDSGKSYQSESKYG